MLNGINQEGMLNSQIDKQGEVSKLMTNPLKNPYQNIDRNLLIDETAISNEAVRLYEKEQDIKKFTSLAMSDAFDFSHDQIIATLFNDGVTDPFSEDAISSLASNSRLIDDLGL